MGADWDGSTQRLVNKNSTSPKSSFCRMIFLGFIVVSPGILTGMDLTFSAIALPQLNLNIDDASWFGSINAVGSTVSAVLGGVMIDKFGRRPTALAATVPPTLGWLLISFGTSTTHLFVGRILTGVTNGIAYISQVYAAECILVNHTHLRNHFNAWPLIVNAFGQLLNYGLSVVLSYQRVAAVASLIGATASFCIYFCIPESPEWLHKKGRLKEALHSEAQLCIYQPILSSEDGPTDDGEGTSELPPLPPPPPPSNHIPGLQLLKRKDVYKPLCITTVWSVLIMFSGGPILLGYMVDLLKLPDRSPAPTFGQSNLSTSNEYLLSVISGLSTLVAIILMSCVITRVGVKWTAMSSTFFMGVGFAAYGVSLLRVEGWQGILDVVHVISIWVAVFAYSFGVITVLMSVVAELFPHDAKGFAGVSSISMGLFAMLSLKLYLYLKAYLGFALYLIYAVVNLITVAFVAVFVPETVGKTAEEISQAFLK